MDNVVSDRQIAANRRNARHSTGPRTPDGKGRAARNALTHGLLAADVVVTGPDAPERPEEFHALRESLLRRYRPADIVQRALVERVAACFWRLRRAQRFEVGAVHDALDQCHRPDPQEQQELEALQRKLDVAQRRRILRERDLQFLQAIDITDPKALRDALPKMNMLEFRYARVALELPAGRIREVLLRELPGMIRQIDEVEIPAIQRTIDDTQRRHQLRRQRQHQTAALPAPDEVLKLVRYENMLDRHLHRALARLENHRKGHSRDAWPPPTAPTQAPNTKKRCETNPFESGTVTHGPSAPRAQAPPDVAPVEDPAPPPAHGPLPGPGSGVEGDPP